MWFSRWHLLCTTRYCKTTVYQTTATAELELRNPSVIVGYITNFNFSPLRALNMHIPSRASKKFEIIQIIIYLSFCRSRATKNFRVDSESILCIHSFERQLGDKILSLNKIKTSRKNWNINFKKITRNFDLPVDGFLMVFWLWVKFKRFWLKMKRGLFWRINQATKCGVLCPNA